MASERASPEKLLRRKAK